jgi:hypothetical protein
MKYFKYLLLVITALFSLHATAVCYHPATYPGTAHKPFPATICYPEGGGGNGYCQFRVIDDGLDIQVPCTNPQGCGSTPAYGINLQSISDKVYKNPDCTNPPLQDGCVQLPNGNIECEEEEEEEDPVLQCSTDSCPNPENKRCPTGYKPGSFNGQNICAKSKTPPDPDPEPCEGENCESDQDVINAVNDANYSITNSINNLSNSFSNSFNQIKNLLSEISEKIQNLGNSGGGDGEGNGNGYGEVDTSDLYAETPISDTDEHYLNQNLFSSNEQCPADNVLNLNFMGSNITYNFSYLEICDALYSLSFIVMILAYMISIYIVSRE